MTEEEFSQILDQTFWKYSLARTQKIKDVNRKFVHYTSFDAAISIIGKKEIWLRNARVMNDYSEIAHGESCIRFCLIDNQELATRTKAVLEGIVAGLYDRAVHWFFERMQHRLRYTYLLSISEHGPLHIGPGTVDEESEFGRLSMWRAYGSSGGVALIFNQDPIMDPRDALPAFVSPVFYGNPDEFSVHYSNMLNQLEANTEALKQVDPELIWENMATFLHFSILSCKHPGFKEEREWRITYSPEPGTEGISDEEFNNNNLIQREFRSVDGIPQRIYKIPLKKYGEEADQDISLSRILNKLVIGPTAFPAVVNDALVFEMLKSGFSAEQIKIAVSQIPMRL